MSTSPRRSLVRLRLVALVVRLVNACLSRAFFQPDEYWQALEPAHRWVWGYGWETWEWRSDTAGAGRAWSDWNGLKRLLVEGGPGGIRSPLAVLPTAAVYWVLKASGWDTSTCLALAPRLLQAVIASTADIAVYRLASRILGTAYAPAAFFASLTSFFNLHTSTRTLSNSTETRLYIKTCVMIWLVLGSQLLLGAVERRTAVMASTIGVGIVAALSCLALDTAFYGTPTFTPLRFLHVNVFRSVSLFYGANASHFYLTQGLPILLLTQLPFFLDGLVLSFRRATRPPMLDTDATGGLRTALGLTVLAYSLLAHKEWRFLHPLLPIMHLFVAFSLVHRFSDRSTGSGPRASPGYTAALRFRPVHALILLASLPPALYLTAFHGLGQTRVTSYLHAILSAASHDAAPSTSVGFLMPCHSTPWQASMHAPRVERQEGDEEDSERTWFLTCEPPVLGQDPTTYLDQSDYFYASPCTYLTSRFPPGPVDPSFPPSPPLAPARLSTTEGHDLGWRHTWPERFVLFSSLLDERCSGGNVNDERTVGTLLRAKGYVEERRFWNTIGGWHEDARRRGDVRVLRWVGDGDEVIRVEEKGGKGRVREDAVGAGAQKYEL
ncbi:hypothetical protein Rhopal_006574-T1 [Rhodotorula paludigena]|uniref:Mannosyltransferase n=1 Tax=Rhodotorula paludigena TaxID=86838 RepID=A0AAV5GWW9_9BASI|nr:hypothetical protein Rhopal_006574-T1 [Rhodotorula paludigena]